MATQLVQGDKKITNNFLQLIKWKDRYREMKELRLYDVLASVWRDLSDLLNLDGYTRKIIETKYPRDPKQCVRDVIEKWLNDEAKLSDHNYKCTWNGLCLLLEDLQLSSASKQLQEALRADISSFNNNTQTTGLKQSLICGDIMRALHEFPSSKARELGVYLDLSPARLEEFSHNNPRDCKKLMQDVISHWLEVDKDQSWMKLAGAVEACGHTVLADTIRSKFS